jgi:hypothetical protein
LLGVSFGGSDVAASTCDPPREQWLAGLGQVLGWFLVAVGATVVARFLFGRWLGGQWGIWVWLGAYLAGSLPHRPPDTSLWCSLPQVNTSHPILMGRRRRVFGGRDPGPART